MVIIAFYQNDVLSGDKRIPIMMVNALQKHLRTYYTYHLFCLTKDVDVDQI